MKTTNQLFVANWKMNLSYSEMQKFLTDHGETLKTLVTDNTLVLCPSFLFLAEAANYFATSKILIGAQNCSAYERGPHTGQVDALSLAEIGVRYCIIGHRECREEQGDTNELIAQKAKQLFIHKITPIICVGSAMKEEKAQKEALERQLSLLFPLFKHYSSALCIAYEPYESIGTGITPSDEHITMIALFIRELCAQHGMPKGVRILYGGSVTEKNAPHLRALMGIDGLLIGGASLDFQKLKNIVL